jgi:uncharacterized protein (DUF302 family)
MTDYRFSRDLDAGFEEALEAVTKALAVEGFGIVSEVNVADTLRKKLGIDFRPYKILGACNPGFAHRAIEAEPDIGVMMPCNVVVQATASGSRVSAMDPMAGMAAVGNADLTELASTVSEKLRRVIESL